jgi:hypothetical protein
MKQSCRQVQTDRLPQIYRLSPTKDKPANQDNPPTLQQIHRNQNHHPLSHLKKPKNHRLNLNLHPLILPFSGLL